MDVTLISIGLGSGGQAVGPAREGHEAHAEGEPSTPNPKHNSDRGTLLIRNSALLAPSSRTMPRDLW